MTSFHGTQPRRGRRTDRSGRPLPEGQLLQLQAYGNRLRAELQEIVIKSQATGMSAGLLCAMLKIDRNICTRILSAIGPGSLASGNQGLDVIRRMPGVEGLRMFVDAAEVACKDKGITLDPESARAAIDQYASFLKETCGSHAALLRRLEIGRVSVGVSVGPKTATSEQANQSEIESRRSLFEIAASIAGMSRDLQTFVNVSTPVPDQPRMDHGFFCSANIGMAWDRPAMPFNFSYYSDGTDNESGPMRVTALNNDIPGSGLILPEFSSSPLPRVTTRSRKRRTILSVDRPAGVNKMDLTLAGRWSPQLHPRYFGEKYGFQMLAMQRPTRRLVLDSYIHRSAPLPNLPTVGCYFWHGGLASNPADYWHDQLPGRYTIELLGSGLRNADTPAWSKHREMVEHAFAKVGWNPDDYIGFRADIQYPIWNSTVLMLIDYREKSDVEDESAID